MLRKELSALLVFSTGPDLQEICTRTSTATWSNSRKKTLAQILWPSIPDPAKREQVERRIQSATNRWTLRTNKPRQPARKKQSARADNDFDLLKVKVNELTTLFNVFFKSENKGRVALFPTVCYTDSSCVNLTESQTKSKKLSLMREANKNQCTHITFKWVFL